MLADPLPPAFQRRVFELAPGEVRPFVASDWADALVLVDAGDLELECLAGGRRAFPRGSVLSLAGLGLRALRNPGPEVLVLTAVSRRPMSSGAVPGLTGETPEKE